MLMWSWLEMSLTLRLQQVSCIATSQRRQFLTHWRRFDPIPALSLPLKMECWQSHCAPHIQNSLAG